jgi:small subunit ribosomal protein S21
MPILASAAAQANPARNGVKTPLSEVIVGESEPFEVALKRFNKRVQQDGILSEARRREHYEKPSVKRKKKEAARLRKLRKKQIRSEARAAARR